MPGYRKNIGPLTRSGICSKIFENAGFGEGYEPRRASEKN
jgi:hypothetical protein